MEISTFTISGIDGPSGLDGLAADLAKEARVAPAEARKVLQRGLLNIKNDWRKRWSGHPHAPRLPYSITYDSDLIGQRIDGEVGPDKDRPQGALGNLFEYGSVNNPPIPGGAPALETERPKYERAMEALPFSTAGQSWH